MICAAILSMTALRFSLRTPLSISTRSAATVLSRSSHISTVSPVLLASISRKASVFSTRSPSVLFMFFGQPSTIVPTPYSRISCSILAQVFRSLFSSGLSIVSTPWAVIPSGSLTATPTVREPKSSPSIRLFSIHLPAQQKSHAPQTPDTAFFPFSILRSVSLFSDRSM